MLITRIVIIVALLGLGACASSPKYTAADRAGAYGHESRKLGDDRYRVNFNGGRRADLEQVRDFALLRAAEITLAEGHDWFQIVDRETATVETAEPRSGFAYERAYAVDRSCGLVSCSRRVRPVTYTRFDIDTRPDDPRHSHSIEIVMGSGEVPDDGHFYDAREVARSIYASL